MKHNAGAHRGLGMVAGQLEFDIPRCARDDPFLAAGLTAVGNHEQMMSAIYSERNAARGLALWTVRLSTLEKRADCGHVCLMSGGGSRTTLARPGRPFLSGV